MENKSTCQKYSQFFFSNYNFDWHSIYTLPQLITVDILKNFPVKNTK